MGIQGLEHFCKKNPDIAEEIDIREEIEKWRVDHHGKNPTIIIDLKELLRVFFRIDEVGLILGGRFEIYKYAKKQQYGPNGYDTEQLTGNLTNADRTKIAENLATLEKYVDWKVEEGIVDDFIQNDETFKSVLRFCKDNIYFAYKLIIETYTIPKDLFYIDIRRSDAITFIDLIINLTMKQLGILFKDIDPEMQPARRMVLLKRDFNVETVKYEKDIIYPSMPLPSLVNLIIDEDNKSFNESRWCLLQNLLDLDEETISKINNAKKQLRIVLYTLKFLLVNEIISTHDADILLVTELDGRSKGNVYVPKNAKRPPPPMPNQHYPRYVEFPWVRIAHKYTIAFEHVCHCLEICGLRKEADIIKFDALKFHKNMHLMKNGKDNEEIKRTMVRIENIRLW
ncbi:uncharacterized protein LOC116338142 isoform X2 [Contarinia nasturtii]|uniref:uncharacterized protein LOC116338142 isoform X2 n=1 Tax=Contarinia nasturtii TaxID=265458 RepID=UPI0012D48BD9|nr:uncharacterized protein LOC116338142 isoform X2 [Contarinia nasturtii]